MHFIQKILLDYEIYNFWLHFIFLSDFDNICVLLSEGKFELFFKLMNLIDFSGCVGCDTVGLNPAWKWVKHDNNVQRMD